MEDRQTDVFDVIWDSGGSSRFEHPTVKDLRFTKNLLRYIIPIRGGQRLAVIPFAGSGTECLACAQLGLDFVGYEIDKDYAEMANRRTKEIQQNLF